MSTACAAAHESAALFPLSRSQIELTGSDRASFLHNFCTNDIKSLQPGQGLEAFVCNVKGRMLGHITVFAGTESLWLESVADAAPALLAHLDRYLIREDVQLHDRTADVDEWHLVGPLATEQFASLTAASLHCVHWFGSPSYLLVGDRSRIDELKQYALSAGLVEGTAADWQSLRIAAGFPQYGVDLTDDHLPQEAARTAQCLSFTKGCYLGQEPIARLDAMGHTNRELRRLRLPEIVTTLPAALIDPASTVEAGTLTSCAPSPDGNGAVGLGMIKTKWQPPGTRLAAGAVPVTVE